MGHSVLEYIFSHTIKKSIWTIWVDDPVFFCLFACLLFFWKCGVRTNRYILGVSRKHTETFRLHCGKADVRTIGYLQHSMADTSNVKVLLTWFSAWKQKYMSRKVYSSNPSIL